MIPHTDAALRHLSQRLMTQVLPDTGTEYSMSDAALIGLLMNAVADEAAEGIHRRLTDIREMREILKKAGNILTAAELDVANHELKSYRLVDVNELHDNLTRILIELHARDENAPEANMDITPAIWRYLRRHAERHAITAVP